MTDSFGARSALAVGGHDYEIYRLDAVKDGQFEDPEEAKYVIFREDDDHLPAAVHGGKK